MKKYIAPEIKVVELESQLAILAASEETLPYSQNPLEEITDPEEIN